MWSCSCASRATAPASSAANLAATSMRCRAVAGMDAIIHAATGARESLTSRATDVGGTRRLIDCAKQAGIGHLAFISIVGIDRVQGYPYYRTKLRTESVVQQGGLPWSILRSTQFHDLMET